MFFPFFKDLIIYSCLKTIEEIKEKSREYINFIKSENVTTKPLKAPKN